MAYKRWREKEFVSRYNQMKSEGLTDRQIAENLVIAKSTLTHYKKIYGLPMTPINLRKSMTNNNGVTREMLEEAKKIGLSSSLINARISNCYWTPEEACSIPPLPRGKKIFKGKVDHDEGIE
jgi:hypothetical protein